MKEYNIIKELENTGLVKTIYTKKGWEEWPSNEVEKSYLYEKLTGLFGTDKEYVIRIPQTHSNKARVVTLDNIGEGIIKSADEGYDAMITNIPGIILCTVEADCVPVYILDPVNKVIGMVHSGWKGTAGIISVNTIELMVKEYNTNPKDIIACLGPCICGECYEVGAELISEFENNYFRNEIEKIFIKRNNEKYLLNLPEAIKISLLKIGVKGVNIIPSPACTFENPDLCSWRRDKNPKARMLTGIMLK